MPAIPNRGIETPYFSFQGRLYAQKRQLPSDTDDGPDLIAPVTAGEWLGNLPRFDYGFSEDIEQIPDYHSGLRGIDAQFDFGTTLDIDLELKGATEFALAIAHGGQWSGIAPGNVSNGTLIVWNNRLQAYQRVSAMPDLNTDYYIGQRAEDGTWQPYRSVKSATLLVKDSTAGTPKTLVENTHFKLYPLQARIRFTNLTTGAPYTAPILANTSFGSVSVELPRNLSWGLKYWLGYGNITALQIQDSAGTPAVVNPAYYEFDPVYGSYQFKRSQLAAMEAANYVYPLRAVFDHGAQRQMAMGSAPLDQEYWLQMEGINTINGQPMTVSMYRVKFRKITGASLIGTRVLSTGWASICLVRICS